MNLANDTLNGFVLRQPMYENDKLVYVFVGNRKNLAANVISLRMLERVITEDCEVLFLVKDLEEEDIKRTLDLVAGNEHMKLSIIPLKVEKKIVFIGLSSIKLEEDAVAFVPFILKRYRNILYIKDGTIVTKQFRKELLQNRGNEVAVCYTDEKKSMLAVWYDAEAYVNHVTLEHIQKAHLASKADEKLEFFSKTCQERLVVKETEHFRSGREGMKYTEEFLGYAKETCYYEKLIFDSFTKGKEKKRYKAMCFLFPFELIEKGKKIAIYGAGVMGTHYMQQMNMTNYCTVVGIVDKNYKLFKRSEYQVEAIEALYEWGYDYVLIANANPKTVAMIKQDLLMMGIPEEKIMTAEKREWGIRE